MKKLLAAALALALLAALPAHAVAAWSGGAEEEVVAIFHNGSPSGAVYAQDGSYLIADVYNKVIWRLSPGGAPSILAGRVGVADQAGEPIGGYNDGPYAQAAFATPWAIAPFLEGYLVSDSANNVVRYFSGGSVLTAVGSGVAGHVDGRGIATAFSYPTGLAADGEGNVYIADTGNNAIRRLTPQGEVTTYAGTGAAGYADGSAATAAFNGPTGLCWHDGALYVADTGNHLIRRIEGGVVTTFAGATHEAGSDASVSGDYLDGGASSACFSSPSGLAFDGNTLYVSDSGNSAVRAISGGQVTTLIAGEADRDDVYPVDPRGLLVGPHGLLICDGFSGTLLSTFADHGDIPTDNPRYHDIAYMTALGLVDGGPFRPDDPFSAEELADILSRMGGEAGGAPFGGGGAAVNPADGRIRNALSKGGGTAALSLGGGDGPISRAEGVAAIARYIRALKHG